MSNAGIATRSGDVIGPTSATDNAIARFDGTTGKLLQGSVLIVDDLGNIIGPAAGFKITGGTGTGADLTFQTTSGVGTTGADIHFLVGNNGSTEAMTILNNGNVGIGTNNPQRGLHVFNNDFLRVDRNSPTYGASLLLTRDDAGTVSSWMFGPANIAGATGDAFGITDYGTATSGVIGSTRLLITKTTGLIGINTNTPDDRLHIVDSVTSGALTLKVQNTSSLGEVELFLCLSGTLTNQTVGGSIVADRTEVGGAGSTDLIFKNSLATTLVENLRINASGNVGIGTTIADRRLEINSATGACLRLTYNDSNGSAANYADLSVSSAGVLTVSPSGVATVFSKPIRLKGYTVATLPAGTQGDTAFVTDSLAPAFLTTVVGGGAVVATVFYNGTNWVVQ